MASGGALKNALKADDKITDQDMITADQDPQAELIERHKTRRLTSPTYPQKRDISTTPNITPKPISFLGFLKSRGMPLCGLELKKKWADREFLFSTRKFHTYSGYQPQNLKLIIWYTAPVWFFHEMRNNDLSITHPIGSHYSQIVFRPTGLKSKSDKSKVLPQLCELVAWTP